MGHGDRDTAARPKDRLPAGRWVPAPGSADPAIADRQGRPPLDLDHGRRHSREGDPGPTDEADGGKVPRLRLRDAQGVSDPGPPGRHGPAWPEPAAPAFVHLDPHTRRTGSGRLCQSIRSELAARRSPRTTYGGSATRSLRRMSARRSVSWTWW